MSEVVRIGVDGRGIPTIVAADEVDAAFALGHVHARDRLFQMDLLRRRAVGTVAELLGAGGVAEDVRQRTLGMRAAAERIAGELPRDQREVLEAYAAGVNDRLAQVGEPPLELRACGGDAPAPWRVADSAAVALLLSQMLTGDAASVRMRERMRQTLPAAVRAFLLPERGPYAVEVDGRPAERRATSVPREELRALLARPAPPRSATPIVGELDLPFGSNAWAVAGRRTTDGRALLANDMHMPLGMPPIFHRARFEYAGRRVDGVAIPGMPLVVAGATRTLAWGATRLVADTIDLIELAPEQSETERCDSGEGPQALRTREETVVVRGGDDVGVLVCESEWGPVIETRRDGASLAMRWSVLEPGGLDFGLLGLPRAADVEEGCDVVNRAASAPLNFVFADAGGRIAWTVAGRLPARAAPEGLVRPARGERSWEGCLDAAELPRVVDPAAGVVISANNLTRAHNVAGHTASNGYSAHRAHRVAELLGARCDLTERDLVQVQLDAGAGFYDFYRERALQALGDAAPGEAAELRAARRAVRAWDGTAAVDARGLPLLVAFRENARETLMAQLLGDCRAADPLFRYCWNDHERPLRALLASDDPRDAPPPHATVAAFLRAELALSARMLARLAPGTPLDQLAWGALNRASIAHVLAPTGGAFDRHRDLAEVPLAGCPESVHAARPGFGPAMRLVVSPSDVAAGQLHLPGGQSGDPTSPHVRDQFDAWVAGGESPLCPGLLVDELKLGAPAR